MSVQVGIWNVDGAPVDKDLLTRMRKDVVERVFMPI
jgi:hypothetical protein